MIALSCGYQTVVDGIYRCTLYKNHPLPHNQGKIAVYDEEVSGSVKMSSRAKKEPVVLLSGSFDPLHVGHIRMIEAARAHGRVIIALHIDAWLKRKKGYVLMPWKERGEILNALHCVYRVIGFNDEDGTARDAINKVRPDYFGNGGDSIFNYTLETELCAQLAVKMIWNLGGGKIKSSSQIVAEAKRQSETYP